jgi:aldehyde:ferredoxin oxidoreductase
MPGGYVGRTLRVDLSTEAIESEPLPWDLCHKYLGGYGFGARYLTDHQEAGVAPLSAGNILGFITGPLTGTPAISGTRFTVVAKSPLTGGWGDANSGGYFGPGLKAAGFDAVYFHGKAGAPVYLHVENGQAKLRPASHLWGLDTIETERVLRDQAGPAAQVACIGPAGERMVLTAGIMSGGRAAARSGLGAVMGSKGLKAIVVVGQRPVPVANPDVAEDLRRELLHRIGGPWAEVWQKYGTAGALAGAVEMGDAPVKNWAGGGLDDFPGASSISDDAVLAYQTKRYACWKCPVACGGHVAVAGQDQQQTSRKPEYETLAAFGPLCLVDDLELIIHLNDISNRAGIDTISAGATIAFAIECFESGLLSSSDTDGLHLVWGNGQAIVSLLDKIVRREGLGDLLADGVKVAAEQIGGGADRYAMHIGGQEVPMHDPRLTMPFLLGYLLDATPARHNQGSAPLIDMPPAWTDLAGAGISSREGYEGKATEHVKLANLMHVINASGLCAFGVCSFVDRFILPEFMEAIVGWTLPADDIFRLGDRIGTLRLAYNFREGLDPLSWKAPDRILGRPPLKSGPLQGVELEITDEVSAFRQAAGWDPETGKPTIGKLKELGLQDLIGGLWADAKGHDQ